MEADRIHAGREGKSILKQRALPYLPRNLGDIRAQQDIWMMIAKIIPAVQSYAEAYDEEIWARVKKATLPLNQAIAQCAYQTDCLIGSVTIDVLAMRALPENDLLQAWIALDYYIYILKEEYSVNLRFLQCQITDILHTLESDGARSQCTSECKVQKTDMVTILNNLTYYEESPNCSEQKSAINQEKQEKAVQPKWNNTQTQTPTNRNSEKKYIQKAVGLAVIILIFTLTAVFLFSDIQKTKASIRKIGIVTLESEKHILKAEQLYTALTDSQRDKISNYDKLVEARIEYDGLVVQNAIEKIDKVTLESKDAIEHAERLYEELSEESKNRVNNYTTLTAARREYNRQEQAVKNASDAIDAIGEVTLNSGSKIEYARKAYDSLKKDDLQKHLSGKVSTLINAEKKYKQIFSKNLYDSGISEYKNGNFDAAIQHFDTIISDYSDTNIVDSAKKAKAECQIELAKSFYKKRDYYMALKTLKVVDEKYQSLESLTNLQDQIVAEITRSRPGSGNVVNGKLNWGQCYFQVTANTQDVCIKFENTQDSTKYKMVFIRSGETVKVNVEDGEYYIKWATGKYWYGKDKLFGDDTQYRSRGVVTFTTTYKGNWIYFKYLDLDMSDSDFWFNTINANNF